jgi:hypothetical protein
VIAEKEYKATDMSGNSSWWSWKLVFNTTILDNGKYWVTAWAWDAEENQGGSDKILIIVNNTITENHWPYVNITHPPNEAKVSGVIKITGHAWDIDGYIISVSIRINGTYYNATDSSGNGTWYSWYVNFNTTILPDGEYKITALSKDNGLKLGDAHNWIIIDNIPEPKNQKPTIWIEHPANNTEVKGEIVIKGHAKDDKKVKLVDLVIAEKEYKATDTSGNGTWWSWKLVFNTTNLKNGKYWVTAWAWDAEENLGGFDKILIVINNTAPPKENLAPNIEINHPKNKAVVSGVIQIKGIAWDSDGNVSIVRIRINEVMYNATDKSGNGTWYNWSLEFNTSKLKDGEYKVTGIAYDNKEKAEDIHILIIIKNKKEEPKNQAPFINITEPSMDTNVSSVVKITGYAFDPDGNISNVRVKIGDKYYNATDTSKNGSWYTWEYLWNSSLLENGSYRISALAFDGMVHEDAHVEVNVNNTISSKGGGENSENNEKPPKRTPGFEMPLLVAAAVAAVVVSFFRSGRNNRAKQI